MNTEITVYTTTIKGKAAWYLVINYLGRSTVSRINRRDAEDVVIIHDLKINNSLTTDSRTYYTNYN